MRLLEYQSKALLTGFGLRFTSPAIVRSVEEAVASVGEVLSSGTGAVLKAQVPFGGRGKLGGVRCVATTEEAAAAATEMLGMSLRDVKVHSLSVEPQLSFERELYVGVTWHTSGRLPVALLSAAGGIEIETSSATLTSSRTFLPAQGLSPFQGREMAAEIGLTGKTLIGIGNLVSQLAAAFLALDAVTAEINPVVETAEGLIGLDAHLEIDDDALYRQRARLPAEDELVAGTAAKPPTALEREAQRIDAMDHRGVAGRVVEFDGDLALLIGGGGASLTVFDAIRRHGGNPANYCEVGGNPTEEKVAALTQLLLSKPGVRKLAVIMNVVNNTRADVMARGLVMGVEQAGLKPADAICLFRIPGSWEQEARALLADVGVEALGREVSLDAAARLAVERMKASAA